jgi:hypothetical protein
VLPSSGASHIITHFPKRSPSLPEALTREEILIGEFLYHEGRFRAFGVVDGDGGRSNDLPVYYVVRYAILSQGRVGYTVLLLRNDGNGYRDLYSKSMFSCRH